MAASIETEVDSLPFVLRAALDICGAGRKDLVSSGYAEDGSARASGSLMLSCGVTRRCS